MYRGIEALSRRIRCAVGFFYGRWYSPVPNKVQLTVLVGKAISVAKVDNPDTEQVLLLQAHALGLTFCCVKHEDARCKLVRNGSWCASYSSDTPHVLQIEQLHQQVVEQVETLYYTHRHLHGWQHRELEIV